MYLAARRSHGVGSQVTTQVVEYDYDDFRAKNSAFDVTGHVPTLINSAARKMVGISADGPILFILTTDPKNAFIYQTAFAGGQQRTQAAWSYMRYAELTEDDRIVDAAAVDSEIVLLTETDAGDILLEYMRWDRDYFDSLAALIGEFPYLPCMDRMMILNGSHASGTTTWTMPFSDEGIYGAVGQNGEGTTLTRVNATTHTATGNWQAATRGPKAVVGKLFRTELQPSPQYLRDQSGLPDVRQDIMVTCMSLRIYRSGLFTVSLQRTDFETVTLDVDPAPEYISRARTYPVYGVGPSNRTVVRLYAEGPQPFNIQTIFTEGEVINSSPRAN
jgi:hypothetical protein